VKSCSVAHILAACIAAVLILAASVTYLCAHHQGLLDVVNPFVELMDSLFSTRRMGSKSNYPDLSAVYHSFAIFAFPISAAWYIAYSYFPPAWWFAGTYSTTKKLTRTCAVMFFLTMIVGYFVSETGQDARLFHVGTSLETLLLFGGIGFGVCGVMLGNAMIDVWKITTDR